MFQHIQHRRSRVAVEDRRHRAYAAEAGGVETAKGQPVVGAIVGGARETQTENIGRSNPAPAAHRPGPERRRAAGRRLVVPVAVAHSERLEAEGRHIQHAEAQKTVQLKDRVSDHVFAPASEPARFDRHFSAAGTVFSSVTPADVVQPHPIQNGG